jgi:putative ABC transport system ATP-binding protein
MKNNVISLRNVWKTYVLRSETVNALKGITLEIPKGSFVSILGPSGSGKSTMMSIVGCLDRPSKGEVFLNNHDTCKLSDDELSVMRGKTLGFVFQKFNLVGTLTALNNVALPLAFQGVSLSARLQRARELLSFVGLEKRFNHKPAELSGGEQQRVAIARALANDPDVILADEPTGNLDSRNGKLIMNLFKKLNDDGKTVIFVTHDSSLTKYSDKIVRIKDGKILEGKK